MGRKSREKQERRGAAEEAVREAAASAEVRRELARSAAEQGRRRGCLFCRRSDGGFASREHVFPESLGNTELVLLAGVVCDRCNHEVCSPLDAALCDFGPVEMMRTMRGIPSKRGKMPSFKFDNGSLEAKSPGELLLKLDSAKWRTPDVRREDGRTEWAFTSQRQDTTPKRLSLVHRSLVKAAVECAWIDHGEELLLSETFDRERDIVVHGKHHGYLLLPKNGVPDGEISLTYDLRSRTVDGAPVMTIAAQVWGIIMVTDTLFAEPPGEVPAELGIVLPF